MQKGSLFYICLFIFSYRLLRKAETQNGAQARTQNYKKETTATHCIRAANKSGC